MHMLGCAWRVRRGHMWRVHRGHAEGTWRGVRVGVQRAHGGESVGKMSVSVSVSQKCV